MRIIGYKCILIFRGQMASQFNSDKYRYFSLKASNRRYHTWRSSVSPSIHLYMPNHLNSDFRSIWILEVNYNFSETESHVYPVTQKKFEEKEKLICISAAAWNQKLQLKQILVPGSNI